jgi:hypothetical protein
VTQRAYAVIGKKFKDNKDLFETPILELSKIEAQPVLKEIGENTEQYDCYYLIEVAIKGKKYLEDKGLDPNKIDNLNKELAAFNPELQMDVFEKAKDQILKEDEEKRKQALYKEKAGQRKTVLFTQFGLNT